MSTPTTPPNDPATPSRTVDGTPTHPAPRRHSRWRDWRTYVGGLGRILIATGLLILAFVAYQLWGTGIQEARAQDDLERELELKLSTTTTAAPTTTVATTVAPTTAPSGATTTTVSTTVSTTEAPTTVPAPAVPPTRPTYQPGDAVARLEIPRIGMNKIVVYGVETADLKRGPGSYPSTPLPGEQGNAGIAGHRTTYGAPFERLDKLRPGDEIITTGFAGRFVYRVIGTKIVDPSDTSVLAPSDDTRLTLTTCHPRYSTKQRLIVTAVLDPEASDPPVPPTTLLPPVTVPTTAPDTGQTVATSAPSDTLAPAPTTVPVATTVPSDETAVDALSRGWFSDPDAWPQVALWGLALTAVSLAAWGVSRATRRNWVGLLAGIVPFVLVLYFFFENVARLLPPNL